MLKCCAFSSVARQGSSPILQVIMKTAPSAFGTRFSGALAGCVQGVLYMQISEGSLRVVFLGIVTVQMKYPVGQQGVAGVACKVVVLIVMDVKSPSSEFLK